MTTPKEMMLGGRGFEKLVGHESEALINEISAHFREVPERSLVPSTM